MLQKLRQWIRKLSFPISLLLMGVLFFTWTDNWQVYTDPLRELYNRGVQLAGGARMGHTSEPGQQDGTVSGDTVPEGTEDPTGESRTPAVGETAADTQTETMTTEEPQPTEPSEELPKEVVYHTVDDSYFDDAVFIGDSRTVGMYEYGGLEETPSNTGAPQRGHTPTASCAVPLEEGNRSAKHFSGAVCSFTSVRLISAI